MKSRKILIGGISLILLALGLAYPHFAIKTCTPAYPPLSIKKSDRVMIIAPHPDDEALATAGVIKYCVDHNIPVEVVIVTNGGFNLAWQRHLEILEAMKQLGLTDNITFLDYPQRLNYLLTQNWNRPYNGSNGIHYSMNEFSHNLNAPYTGESLVMELEDVIRDFKPTIIIYPDSNDTHLDHWATSAFVEYAITKLDYKCTSYGYIIHTPSLWPSPHSYSPNSYLTPPSYLSGSDWVEFPLTEENEKFKTLAIKSYKSQLKKSSSLLLSFVRRNELFSVQHPINLTSPGNSSKDSYPNVISKDPENDMSRNFDSSVDLTNIGLGINNGAWISLQTNGQISTNNTYEFHLLIIYENNTTGKIDIQVKGGRYSINKYGVTLSSPIIINEENDIIENSIIVRIPTTFKKGDKIIMSADAIGFRSIDMTPWQLIEIT